MQKMSLHSPGLRLFFFWSGIIATFAYRIIIVLNFYNPLWVKIAWYVGTVGFIIYFIHRYQISEKRANIITKHKLLKKVDTLPINDSDKQAMQYVFKSVRSSKEKWNYIFIFALSGLALIIGIILDFVV